MFEVTTQLGLGLHKELASGSDHHNHNAGPGGGKGVNRGGG